MLNSFKLCTPSKEAQGHFNAGDNYIDPHDPNMLNGQQVRLTPASQVCNLHLCPCPLPRTLGCRVCLGKREVKGGSLGSKEMSRHIVRPGERYWGPWYAQHRVRKRRASTTPREKSPCLKHPAAPGKAFADLGTLRSLQASLTPGRAGQKAHLTGESPLLTNAKLLCSQTLLVQALSW